MDTIATINTKAPARARVIDVVEAAAKLSKISVADITGPRRHRRISLVRQACFLVAREHGHSFPMIGARMARDHSTVLDGIQRAKAWAARDLRYRNFVEDLRATAKAPDWSRNPTLIPIRSVKPKNDFHNPDGDGGQSFHDGIADGSAALARALAREGRHEA